MCKTRKGASKCVVALSVLAGLCGVLAILSTLGLFDTKGINQASINIQELKKTVNGGKGILHSHAAALLIMSFLGCSLYKIKNKCFTMCFGFCLGFVWILCVITGVVSSAAAIGAPLLAQGICAGSTDGYLGFGSKLILNNYMCTRACPCEPAAQATFNQGNNTYFNRFNRT